MSREVISTILKHNNVFIAHCSSYAEMFCSNYTKSFSELGKLTNAAKGGREISCSTIGPNDVQGGNFTGYIGLILNPKSLSSITWASPSDGGTRAPEKEGQPRIKPYVQIITEQLLIESVTKRSNNEYNEICINEYDVLGVFMYSSVRFKSDIPPDFEKKVKDSEIVDALPDLPYFILKHGYLFEVEYDQLNEGFLPPKRRHTCGGLY